MINLGNQLGGPADNPAKTFGRPSSSLGLETPAKMLSVNYIPHTLNIYGGNIDVSFVLSQAKEPLCVTRSSSRVLVFDRIDCSQSPIFS